MPNLIFFNSLNAKRQNLSFLAKMGANVKLDRGKVNIVTGIHWLAYYNPMSTLTPYSLLTLHCKMYCTV